MEEAINFYASVFYVEGKSEYKVEKKSGAEHGIANAADKVKAGAKAIGKKVTDPDRDLGTEYNLQKANEKLD